MFAFAVFHNFMPISGEYWMQLTEQECRDNFTITTEGELLGEQLDYPFRAGLC